MASVGFLVLIVVGTSRPLSRLTARAMRLSEGDIDLEPLVISGPSDVRAVTATFNTVAQVLGSFDAQVRRLSSGDDLDEIDADQVPGMLGRSLRGQIAHLSDMTSRLRESEALSRAIIETAADAIWTVDARGRILTANEMAERLLGVDERQQVGKSLLRTFRLQGSFRDAHEIELVRPDGTKVDVLISHSEVPTEPNRSTPCSPVTSPIASASSSSSPTRHATTGSPGSPTAWPRSNTSSAPSAAPSATGRRSRCCSSTSTASSR
jgi:PAS domain-containing protein